jgi:hypothetical protein
LISFILAAAPAAAQQWDPDRCLTCHDSQLHFVAGASIDVAAHIILPKTTIWQRLAVVATIALAYELGQESATRTAGIHGPGYGLGPKDWALTVAGGAVLEGAWSLGRRIFR